MSDKPPTVKKLNRLGAQRTTAPTQSTFDFPSNVNYGYVEYSGSYSALSPPTAAATHASASASPYGAPLSDPYSSSQISYVPPPDPYNPSSNLGFSSGQQQQQQWSASSAHQQQAHQQQHQQSSMGAFQSAFQNAGFQSPMPQFNPSFINNPIMGQFLQDQVSNFSSDLVNKGRSWFDRFKYLFAVDTAYVLKKLILLLFPFAQKDWLIKYNSSEPVAPRDDINVPDLYIPSMAFVTYILLAGYLLGLQSLFTPEKLGIQASFALFWLLFEVFCSIVGLHLFGVQSGLGFFNLLSYSSYKFVFMIFCLLAGVLFNNAGYWTVLGYCSLALGYFLVRSLNIAIQTGSVQQQQQMMMGNNNKSALYLVLGLSLLQPLLMYIMTKHLIAV